jgi:hypothetical protein
MGTNGEETGPCSGREGVTRGSAANDSHDGLEF